MALGDINVHVNTSILTIGRVRVQLPNALTGAQTPITLKNVAGDIPTVEQLRNVNSTAISNGSTLVYNANTHNYDVRELTLSEIDTSNGQIDGGSFLKHK